MRRWAVSEILATLILIVIAVSLGTILVSWASSYSSSALGGLASSTYRAQATLRQYPVIEYANATPTNLTLMVSNEGQLPATVTGILVSNTTSQRYYSSFYAGGSHVSVSSVQIPPMGVVEISVNPNGFMKSGGSYSVAVLTSSGASASTVVGVGP
ncbi:archaellin/type IV pilin N-terminal domain-containing protein [Conexivisphaera calida]|uniref:archaellin/type IV pilin N-terminal domain-containing protein n=1 Tax=Conexivisphaera calida TaxID=1874277 RepID=UPI00157B9F8A|nr:archaellin/type IV pilin N-terminal domain-containing protein [Conexivisphaera calida]